MHTDQNEKGLVKMVVEKVGIESKGSVVGDKSNPYFTCLAPSTKF